MEIKKRKFQGALNILSFNRHYYIIGLLVLATIIAALTQFQMPPYWIWIISGAFIYGLVMPLVVSAYVYDFSGYYNFYWFDTIGLRGSKPQEIISVNAGFDETSYTIKENFPDADIRVFDFYDAKQHTEPAIVRARKVSVIYPNTQQINSDYIPVEDNSIDIVFLLSAAHEIRSREERVKFLMECKRICKPQGKVITVEHLRDLPNFFAFSVGFTHFFSRSVWEKSFREAGFSSFHETKFTPFMSIFDCRP